MQKAQLLRIGLSADNSVAMGKAAETGNHPPMLLGIIEKPGKQFSLAGSGMLQQLPE
jgi:hypothetical protein